MSWLTKQEVIESFCNLATDVNSTVFDYKLASDCFCGAPCSGDYRFDSEILDFIVDAVQNKIEGEQKVDYK